MTAPSTPTATQRQRDPRNPSRRWRGLRDLDPIIVNCRDDHQPHRPAEQRTGLCDRCLADLELVLSDVPYLLDDLDIAIAGQVEFVERGQRRDQTEEERDRGGSNPAVAAHHRLTRALQLAADWFDARHPEQLALELRRVLPELADEPALRKIAREISHAASRAHRVTDRPNDLWYYGPCPLCGADILQERIPPDDNDKLVKCNCCEYAETAARHTAAQLFARDDDWLPEGRLLEALTANGMPVTRHQLNGWLRRRSDLIRERRPWPRWVSGSLQVNDVWCYRFGDIRGMAAARASTKSG